MFETLSLQTERVTPFIHPEHAAYMEAVARGDSPAPHRITRQMVRKTDKEKRQEREDGKKKNPQRPLKRDNNHHDGNAERPQGIRVKIKIPWIRR